MRNGFFFLVLKKLKLKDNTKIEKKRKKNIFIFIIIYVNTTASERNFSHYLRKSTTMSVFRWKKNYRNNTTSYDNHDDNNSREEILKEQVSDLQLEMRFLNKRLQKMQAVVQSTTDSAKNLSTVPLQVARQPGIRLAQPKAGKFLTTRGDVISTSSNDEINFYPTTKVKRRNEKDRRAELHLSAIFYNDCEASYLSTEDSERKTIFNDNQEDLFHGTAKESSIYIHKNASAKKEKSSLTGSQQPTNNTTKNVKTVKVVIGKVRTAQIPKTPTILLPLSKSPIPTPSSPLSPTKTTQSTLPLCLTKIPEIDINSRYKSNYIENEARLVNVLDEVSAVSISSSNDNLNQDVHYENTPQNDNNSETICQSNTIPYDFVTENTVGFEEKQEDNLMTESNNSTSDFQKNIQAGIRNLKTVQRSQEAVLTDDVSNNILANIRAGVKLRQVEISKKETPMSALLINIQERKEACMHQGLKRNKSEIDW